MPWIAATATATATAALTSGNVAHRRANAARTRWDQRGRPYAPFDESGTTKKPPCATTDQSYNGTPSIGGGCWVFRSTSQGHARGSTNRRIRHTAPQDAAHLTFASPEIPDVSQNQANGGGVEPGERRVQ